MVSATSCIFFYIVSVCVSNNINADRPPARARARVVIYSGAIVGSFIEPFSNSERDVSRFSTDERSLDAFGEAKSQLILHFSLVQADTWPKFVILTLLGLRLFTLLGHFGPNPQLIRP